MPYIVPNIFNPSEYEEASIPAIVAKIKSAEMHKLVTAIRQKKNKKEAELLKHKLPAFAFGEYSGVIKPSARISTTHLIFDIDGIDKNDMLPLRSRLESFCLFSFITPSNKGYKFVIEMDKQIDQETYDGNYSYYLDLFEEMLNVKLDRAYRAAQTFFSYDAECQINPRRKKFPVYDIKPIMMSRDVDEYTVDRNELSDLMDFLAELKHPLPYHEWAMVALTLKTVEDGEKLFMKLAKHDTSPGDSKRKWDSCGTPKIVTLGTLYHIAFQYGYRRKMEYVENGKGCKHPFLLKRDGWYAVRKEWDERVFGWKTIRRECVIEETDGNEKILYVILDVDGRKIKLANSDFKSAASFRDSMLRFIDVHMHTSDPQVYNSLFNYLDRTKKEMCYTHLHGVGRVRSDVWNLGNVVIMNGKLMPFEPSFLTKENAGLMLTETKAVRVIERSNANASFYGKLDTMFRYYDNWAAVAIGWAFANIFFTEEKGKGFPILFIHGKTASGKTQLAHVILSMFGVYSPASTGFKINMTDATAVAMSRVKQNAMCIPHIFDEYGGHNGVDRARHFQKLKAFYDASSRTRAYKDNTNDVDSLDVNSGTIMTACSREVEPEAVNRCVYINMDGVKQSKSSMDWAKEFQGSSIHDLSPFIINAIIYSDYEKWRYAYEKCYELLLESQADSRIVENYAKVYAGYETVRDMVRTKCDLPALDVTWWLRQIKAASEFGDDSDPVNVFVQTLIAMSTQGKYGGWLDVVDGGLDPESQRLVEFLWFRNGKGNDNEEMDIAITEVKRYNWRLADQIRFTGRELTSAIKKHPYYRCSGTHYFHNGIAGASYYAHCLAIPTGADEPETKKPKKTKEKAKKEEQDTIPF